MNRIQKLQTLGQSIWLDFIERNMVRTGELQKLVDEGLGGVTSNPTIFQQAIAKSDAYTEDLKQLIRDGQYNKDIFESLAIADIQAGADVLRPVYEKAGHADGFISLEVAPDLAYDLEGTVTEAKRLWKAVNRPNLMVKVPATKPGVEAIRRLIAEGLNINVTLIFSIERYAAVKEAFLSGLEERMAAGKSVANISSVASFFVSRVDANIDSQLEKMAAVDPTKATEIKRLYGKAAVANAKLAYRQFTQVFSGPRWEKLAAAGAQVQRPLWASTSTKNPAYPDLIYVDSLIGPHTVNTMPPKTLEAFRDHGTPANTVELDVDQAAADLAALDRLGISLAQVTEELEIDGVKKFTESFNDLLKTIEKRREEMLVAA
ncbi:MAG: transaldolase [Caldilineaceae bacterium]